MDQGKNNNRGRRGGNSGNRDNNCPCKSGFARTGHSRHMDGHHLLDGWGVQAGESPKTRLVLRITKVNNDCQVIGDDIDRGYKGVPVNLTYKYPHVHAEISGTPDLFDGMVNRAGTEIPGKWKENSGGGPLVFKRTANPPPFPEPLTDAEFLPRAGSDLQGFWKGVIKTGKNGLEVNIKIAEASDGTFRADFYCPPQGGVRQPTSVSYDRDDSQTDADGGIRHVSRRVAQRRQGIGRQLDSKRRPRSGYFHTGAIIYLLVSANRPVEMLVVEKAK